MGELFDFFLFRCDFRLYGSFKVFNHRVLLFSSILLRIMGLFFLTITRLSVHRFDVDDAVAQDCMFPFTIKSEGEANGFSRVITPFRILPRRYIRVVPTIEANPFFRQLARRTYRKNVRISL